MSPEYVFTNDDLGRVTEIDNDATPDAPKVLLTMGYDSASRRTSLAAEIANTDDFLNTYQYDNVGRMTLVDQDQQSGGNSVSEKRVNFEYNDLGQYTEITRYADVAGTLDVVTSFYTYDDADRLTDLDHKQGSTVLSDYRKRTVNRILQVFVFWEDLISPQIGASNHRRSLAKFGERIVLATSA